MKKPPSKHKKGKINKEDIISRNIASPTDCTGLFYKPPVNDADTEAYEELYAVPQQTDVNAQSAKTPEQQKKVSSVKKGKKR